MAHLTINVGEQVIPPIVHDNSIKLNTTEYVFDVNSFTKDFSDPEGGTYNLVTIKSLIGIDGLQYNGSPILIEDSFPVANSGYFKFTLAPKYSIHNGVLYEYEKDIDLILADYRNIGYELVANTNGLLTFIHPTDLSLQYVQGRALPNDTLAFRFTVSSTVSNLPSNEATFSMIPWENVNLKDNFYSIGGGAEDGDSAYQVAINNGFIGTEQDWLLSLVGPKGDTGETGASGQDGQDGTSVTILGSYPTLGNLQTAHPTGNPGESYLVNGYLYVWNGNAWENVGLIQGPRGYDGRGLEYQWNGTQLGVRYEGQINYSFVDLKGATGAIGPKGDKGDQGLRGLKGDTGAQGPVGPKGDKGDKGDAGTNGVDGKSAYQVWLDNGNSGTEAQYIASLKGAKGDSGENASFTHNEYAFDWLTGQPQIFTVPDANKITDVYVDGKRVEKYNPDGTPDEWRVISSTQVEIIVPLDNNDRILLVENAKFSYADTAPTYEDVETALGYKAANDAEVIKSVTGQGVDNTDPQNPIITQYNDTALSQRVTTAEADIDSLEVAVSNIHIPEIVDALTSISTDKTLSANQGRILKGFIDDINTLLNSDDTTLDQIQEIVDYIKLNRSDLENLSISSIAGLQTALDSKVDKDGTKVLTDVNFTVAKDNKLTGIEAGAQVNTVNSVAGKTGSVTLTKGDVGLSNVNNTSDLDKPISTATSTALGNKVDKITGKGLSTEDYTTAEKNKLASVQSGAQANTVTSVAGKTGAVSLSKNDVGLGSVNNTADIDKGVSTAQAAAIDTKMSKQPNIQAMWSGTQAAYDAIAIKNATTIYFIEE